MVLIGVRIYIATIFKESLNPVRDMSPTDHQTIEFREEPCQVDSAEERADMLTEETPVILHADRKQTPLKDQPPTMPLSARQVMKIVARNAKTEHVKHRTAEVLQVLEERRAQAQNEAYLLRASAPNSQRDTLLRPGSASHPSPAELLRAANRDEQL